MLPGLVPFLSSGLVINAVDFDGSNDELARGGDYTGIADGKQGIMSFWFRMDGDDGALQFVINASGGWGAYRDTDNKMKVYCAKPGASLLAISSTGTYTASATWHHLMASWDLALTTSHLYIDGADVQSVVTRTNDTIDYTRTNHYVGSGGAANWFNGCLAQVYVHTAAYLDLSQAGNRAKFYNSGPVDLGATGTLPTGSQPVLYLNDPAASFGTNSGSGGNLTVNGGGLAVASTTP